MRSTRIDKRMTIRQLSIETGINASRISALESGRAAPSDYEVYRLRYVLGQEIKFTDPETAEKNKAEFDSRMAGMAAVIAETRRLGFGRDRGGTGEMDCPKCGSRLFFSVASINGHVWAKCSKDGCIGFMQ